VFALFVVSVAACEAGIAMALFIALYRRNRSLDATVWQQLREQGVAATLETDTLPKVIVEADPVLPVAGKKPEEAARV
jgi:NADH-quinone oxidoreductase subunit K